MKHKDMRESIQSLGQRIRHSLEYSEKVGYPFDIAHYQQIYGRFALLLVESGGLEDVERDLNAAVSGLRRSGQRHHIASAFLDRAALQRAMFCNTNEVSRLEAAIADLKRAESIAERGSMLIWQVEAALERSRLYLALASANSAPMRETSSGNESHAEAPREYVRLAQQKLDEARALIKKTEQPYEPYVPDWSDWKPPKYVGVFKQGEIVGYHRRNDEIEALQAAIDRET